LESLLPTLLISEPRPDTSHLSRYSVGQTRRTHHREGQQAPARRRGSAIDLPEHDVKRANECRDVGKHMPAAQEVHCLEMGE
jgi:hypothetical protein